MSDVYVDLLQTTVLIILGLTLMAHLIAEARR